MDQPISLDLGLDVRARPDLEFSYSAASAHRRSGVETSTVIEDPIQRSPTTHTVETSRHRRLVTSALRLKRSLTTNRCQNLPGVIP